MTSKFQALSRGSLYRDARTVDSDPAWPIDLEDVRLWPMEGDDGPLLQEMFDDLTDFRTPFGEPGAADAVSTFLALPEGRDYDSKLLVGVWRNGHLAGAPDCIMGYPTSAEWTTGLLVVADRHRRSGIASTVLDWLARTAADREAATLRVVVREGNQHGMPSPGRGYEPEDGPSQDPGFVVLARALDDSPP